MTDIFFELHKDLPCQGAGDAASTLRAFRMLEGLPSNPHVLDKQDLAMELFQKYSEFFGHEFYVMQKA